MYTYIYVGISRTHLVKGVHCRIRFFHLRFVCKKTELVVLNRYLWRIWNLASVEKMNSPQASGKFGQLSGSSRLPFPNLDSSGTTYSSCAHCTRRTENSVHTQEKDSVQSKHPNTHERNTPTCPCLLRIPTLTQRMFTYREQNCRKTANESRKVGCVLWNVRSTKMRRNVISDSSREKRADKEIQFTHAFSASLTSALASASDIPSLFNFCPIAIRLEKVFY